MKPYITFRKKFILPIKYLFEEMGMIRKVDYPDRGDLLLRLDDLRAQLIFCQKKQKKDEIKLIEARIEELEWVAYGNSKA